MPFPSFQLEIEKDEESKEATLIRRSTEVKGTKFFKYLANACETNATQSFTIHRANYHRVPLTAKFLVAEGDEGLNRFVQEYANSIMALPAEHVADIKKKVAVYLLPSGFNSLSSYLATHDKLYRQQVFQFFSRSNPQFT